MRLQAKLIICLIVFGLVSYSLDAVTTAIGLNWGYVETNPYAIQMISTFGFPLVFLFSIAPFAFVMSLEVFAYRFAVKDSLKNTASIFSNPQRLNFALWGLVFVCVIWAAFTVPNLVMGSQNLFRELSNGPVKQFPSIGVI